MTTQTTLRAPGESRLRLVSTRTLRPLQGYGVCECGRIAWLKTVTHETDGTLYGYCEKCK